jgi:hypothetical protein
MAGFIVSLVIDGHIRALWSVWVCSLSAIAGVCTRQYDRQTCSCILAQRKHPDNLIMVDKSHRSWLAFLNSFTVPRLPSSTANVPYSSLHGAFVMRVPICLPLAMSSKASPPLTPLAIITAVPSCTASNADFSCKIIGVRLSWAHLENGGSTRHRPAYTHAYR